MIAKAIMKNVWKSKCEWDDEVSLEIKNSFVSFLKQLPNLKKLRIPRWIKTEDDHSKIDLFGFFDASTVGYGACVCVRDKVEDKLILLSGKTKIAPSEFVSVARLELCGAVLLTELLSWAQELFKQDASLTAFCDSKIVLAWLGSHPSKWKVFIANRTTQILDFLGVEHWHYIDTKHNPADYASRGLFPNEIICNSFWWNGPPTERLSIPEVFDPDDVRLKEIEAEQRIKASPCLLCTAHSNDLLEKYSSHNKLLATVGVCCKFLVSCLLRCQTKSERVQPH